MKLVDTIINARWIIPIEPSDIYQNHSLVIDKGRIVDLLPNEQAAQFYQATTTKDMSTHALLPGFVNCHTHAAMSLLRGIADDLPLMDWLQNHIWPLEQQWVNEDFVRDGTELAIAEMLRSGTTCFNDMYFFPEITAQQVLATGIRASIGLIVFDFPTIWASNSDAYINKGIALYEQLNHKPLLSFTFAPHAPYTVSDAPLAKISELSEKFKLPIHIHVHETLHEVDEAILKTGQRPLQRLQQLGLLKPNLLAVHMTQLTPEDITLMAVTGGHIVHCPESNLKLASGFCPIAECFAAGINIALGTDGAASNNDLDILGEMRTAALLAKAVANNAAAVPAMTALKMATINGAKALGLDTEIGSLSIGKAADVIAIDLHTLETQPLFNPVSQIVYAANRQQITDVWVAGKHLLKNRQLTSINETELLEKISHWQQRLENRA